MPTKCTKKWSSIRKRGGFLTEKCHVKVDEPGPGQLKGTHIEKAKEVKVDCFEDGMTWEIPATGNVEYRYSGKFDGDKFPPGLYDKKEDHITGTCTVFNKAGDFELPFDDDEVWTAEKTT